MTKGISPRPRSVHRTGTTTMASSVPFLNLKPFFRMRRIFPAADIKFICANMRLYTILIGTSETEKSAPHFRACVTKKHVADIPFICVNIRLYKIQFGTSERKNLRRIFSASGHTPFVTPFVTHTPITHPRVHASSVSIRSSIPQNNDEIPQPCPIRNDNCRWPFHGGRLRRSEALS